ncbi:MAG: hypothetical protein HY860_02365 [Chlamydiales bacterium]|nr:hypothetical protein [Chlamydiales bacterium]
MNYLNEYITKPMLDWRDLSCIVTGTVDLEQKDEQEHALFVETGREEFEPPLYKRVGFVLPAMTLGVANLIEGVVRQIIGIILLPLNCLECSQEFCEREFEVKAIEDLTWGVWLLSRSIRQLADVYAESTITQYVDTDTQQVIPHDSIWIPPTTGFSPTIIKYFREIDISLEDLSDIREKDLTQLISREVTHSEMETIIECVKDIQKTVLYYIGADALYTDHMISTVEQRIKIVKPVAFSVIDDFMKQIMEALDGAATEPGESSIEGDVGMEADDDVPSLQNRLEKVEIEPRKAGVMPFLDHCRCHVDPNNYLRAVDVKWTEQELTLFSNATMMHCFWSQEDNLQRYFEYRGLLSNTSDDVITTFHQAIEEKLQPLLTASVDRSSISGETIMRDAYSQAAELMMPTATEEDEVCNDGDEG